MPRFKIARWWGSRAVAFVWHVVLWGGGKSGFCGIKPQAPPRAFSILLFAYRFMG